jgi:hypothetical protein
MSPCHVDPPSPQERRLASEYFDETVQLFDDLTHRNDVLREAVLEPDSIAIGTSKLLKMATDDFSPRFKAIEFKGNRASYASPDHKYMAKAVDAYTEFLSLVSILAGEKTLTAKERKRIEKVQREHRVEDLKRLAKVAIDKWDMDLLKTITSATADKPLEPQLGFDPDSL